MIQEGPVVGDQSHEPHWEKSTAQWLPQRFE
jgi:hypothetical protein